MHLTLVNFLDVSGNLAQHLDLSAIKPRKERIEFAFHEADVLVRQPRLFLPVRNDKRRRCYDAWFTVLFETAVRSSDFLSYDNLHLMLQRSADAS
jgi:hypothetical protein